jgi:hypothetical protein
MKYKSIPEFEADFKKLKKSYPSLADDIENMKTSLLESYFEQEIQTSKEALVKLVGFCDENYLSIKVRKFRCKCLKNMGVKSGIRVIFVLQKHEQTITFIEIYYKWDKENEDRNRLQKWFKELSN